MKFFFNLILLVLIAAQALAFIGAEVVSSRTPSLKKFESRKTALLCKGKDDASDIEKTTLKYGFEAGLFKSLTAKDGESTMKPGELFKKYGAAYLITSITLAIISYALCYVAVSNGIDVAALLGKIGIKATSSSSTAGTAGIAYAIHKAASPIRFPPTVALTPVVAGWISKKPKE